MSTMVAKKLIPALERIYALSADSSNEDVHALLLQINEEANNALSYAKTAGFPVTWPDEDNQSKCPDCGATIRAKELWEGGGIECSAKCGYWFCF